MENFRFADLHCHPNLKPFGQSFGGRASNPKRDIWYSERTNLLKYWITWFSGITRFSQADLSTMGKGNVKLALVSLYPLEKGYFVNKLGDGPLTAILANMFTGFGYDRIRHLQTHVDYFRDLMQEYEYFLQSPRENAVDGTAFRWVPVRDGGEASEVISRENEIAVVFAIEGAHVFNSGLRKYGRETMEEEVLFNIRKVKEFPYPPAYITFAHNFNNDLCGHARSLDPVKIAVDQEENLNEGFFPLGEKAVDALLSDKPIYIDLKHMSLKSRNHYRNILQSNYSSRNIPQVVSHGAVTGLKLDGTQTPGLKGHLFNPADINFFDEEIVDIARSGGVFAIQFDRRRIASNEILRKLKWELRASAAHALTARIIWNQVQHIAELLDRHQLYAWGTASIGSDFDGTINPLSGLLTMRDFPRTMQALLSLADEYLKKPNRLSMPENKGISPEEVIHRFSFQNIFDFISRHY